MMPWTFAANFFREGTRESSARGCAIGFAVGAIASVLWHPAAWEAAGVLAFSTFVCLGVRGGGPIDALANVLIAWRTGQAPAVKVTTEVSTS